MNPYDNVGTTRLSTSVHDRLCRLAIGYQDAAAERGIVALRAPLPELGSGAVRTAGRRRGGGHPRHPRARGHPAGQQRARRHRPHPGRRAAARPARRLRRPEGTPSSCTTRWSSRCPAGSSWTRPSTPRRSRCCGRSGRTSSSWSRPRRRLVEERCRPTRRCGGPGPDGPAADGAAAAPAQAARRGARGCSRRPAAGPRRPGR